MSKPIKQYIQGTGLYMEPVGGMLVQEVFMIKSNGDLAIFPIFVVLTPSDKDVGRWKKAYSRGDFLELGFNEQRKVQQSMVKIVS